MPPYALADLKPAVHTDTWIAPNASVIGRVIIDAQVSIWFNCTVRADHDKIWIRTGTNIQEGCILHIDEGFPLTVGENCTIGHKAILHGCTIGNNCLIGMGAIVLNGAKVGDNCLIGAGALIPENKVIPEGSLVLGVPGRVTRKLNAAEVKANQNSAAHYQANMRHFRDHLKVLAVD
ncbi:MAG: gamma carbonic anhydrase family protein [Aestuariivita sp.]|nr:gamma carbonic anhydrase family protein [Aestuariivita sp.]MCY4201094.1 gamma carbonic anhydrase family protein [Aestuariivita sp.]MCY4288281.1 gamma carbonic anhydrase family protein [Aestuariivita sp.]MCY4345925.1 gamma carbonic anhydrase family protein [Aestuariivita sp.]